MDMKTEFAFEARVKIGPAVTLGESPSGVRRVIPIAGGTFEGPRLKGTVIAGGADWQLVRADGVTLVEALYVIREEDGTSIYVRNWGVIVPPEGGLKPDSPPGAVYVRTSPQFEAPSGKHDWLNRSLFLGTLGVEPDRSGVIVGVHRVL
jgi:hypothetical protein